MLYNVILCKRDKHDYRCDDSLIFKEGDLYVYEYYTKNDMSIVWDINGRSHLFSVDRFNRQSKYEYEFSNFFYTPEETITMIRRNKINKVLNDE